MLFPAPSKCRASWLSKRIARFRRSHFGLASTSATLSSRATTSLAMASTWPRGSRTSANRAACAYPGVHSSSALSGAVRRGQATEERTHRRTDNIGVLLIQRALSTLRDFSARVRRDCDAPQAFQFLDSNLTPDSNHLDRAIGGALVI